MAGERVKELEARIASLRNTQHTDVQQSTLWTTLDDNIKGISQQEIEAINADLEVSKARDAMMGVFTGMFLFSRFRDEFASIPAFRPLCDQYISAILKAKADTFRRATELEAENKRLKEELEKLKGVTA